MILLILLTDSSVGLLAIIIWEWTCLRIFIRESSILRLNSTHETSRLHSELHTGELSFSRLKFLCLSYRREEVTSHDLWSLTSESLRILSGSRFILCDAVVPIRDPRCSILLVALAARLFKGRKRRYPYNEKSKRKENRTGDKQTKKQAPADTANKRKQKHH